MLKIRDKLFIQIAFVFKLRGYRGFKFNLKGLMKVISIYNQMKQAVTHIYGNISSNYEIKKIKTVFF